LRRRAPRARPQIRSQAEFEALYGAKAPAGKRYFHHTRLPEIIGAYPLKPAADEGRERERRQAFLDFLLGVLARARGPRPSSSAVRGDPVGARAIFFFYDGHASAFP